MSIMVEDFCLQKTVGAGEKISSLDCRAVEQTSAGWFDGVILLDFFREIIERHGENFPEKNSGDIKMSFWKMTDDNPNKSEEVGDLICIQVENSTYVVCPVRRNY